jgi:flagellin
MSISFQTNIASMIAAVNLNNNNNFQTNTIEQLTSGYRINNSGDDAAGLAVANGYAANISELTQGVLNGNQGVNTLQIIDGGLSNISTMLNRMQTLATESATTTFTGNRATLDQEYQTLIGEINREAGNVGLGATNNTNAADLSVYIGGGQTSQSGSAVNINLTNGLVDATALGLTGTSVSGASPVKITGNTALTAVQNGLIAVGNTETYTVNTSAGSSTFGITGQAGDTATSQLARLNADLGTLGISASLNTSGELTFSSPQGFSVSVSDSAGTGLATSLANPLTNIINTSLNNSTINYVAADINGTTGTVGTTGVSTTYAITEGTTTATINLGTGLSDSAALQSINQQLQSAGITDLTAVATGTTGQYSLQGATNYTVTQTAGSGAPTSATLNPSANVPADDPSAVTASTGGNGALNAINAVTAAVQLLGKVQGTVGAGENDLNYAIGLANSQITNFSATESSIRDADVATEAANLTKAQVLEQASVAAMAQANSAPQVILSLLKSA